MSKSPFSGLLSELGFSVSLFAARVVKGGFLSPPSREELKSLLRERLGMKI